MGETDSNGAKLVERLPVSRGSRSTLHSSRAEITINITKNKRNVPTMGASLPSSLSAAFTYTIVAHTCEGAKSHTACASTADERK